MAKTETPVQQVETENLPEGFICKRDLGDGRWLGVEPLLHGYAYLGITIGANDGYDDYWQYQNVFLAVAAGAMWDPSQTPEPEGWYKHPKTCRRRPNGDPAQEYVEC